MGRKIAILDYHVVPTNPVGGCLWRMLRGLCHEHEFTVFAVEFDNPCPERIRFVRIPALRRPLALLFVTFHLVTPFIYWAHRLRTRVRFGLRQMVESNCGFGDISYSQFCHRAFLRMHWQAIKVMGLRGVVIWLNHQLHALIEPWVYRKVRRIVVPSLGLARELAEEYPFTREKIDIIPNPIDLERMHLPEDFDRRSFRRQLGLDRDDLALAFVALGHFERKGLPLLLEALKRLPKSPLKLIVVGGQPDLVAAYKARVECMGLSGRVTFVGLQRDVRPYFWAADAFAFPSYYEVFPLVSLEAAAAGLPLLITPLYGVEEFIRPGENGILLERTPAGVARGLARFTALASDLRRAMGKQAQQDVARYTVENFVGVWRAFYDDKDLD